MRMTVNRLIKLIILPLSCFKIYTVVILFVVLFNVKSIVEVIF